jgi:hypothetical protein
MATRRGKARRRSDWVFRTASAAKVAPKRPNLCQGASPKQNIAVLPFVRAKLWAMIVSPWVWVLRIPTRALYPPASTELHPSPPAPVRSHLPTCHRYPGCEGENRGLHAVWSDAVAAGESDSYRNLLGYDEGEAPGGDRATNELTLVMAV